MAVGGSRSHLKDGLYVLTLIITGSIKPAVVSFVPVVGELFRFL